MYRYRRFIIGRLIVALSTVGQFYLVKKPQKGLTAILFSGAMLLVEINAEPVAEQPSEITGPLAQLYVQVEEAHRAKDYDKAVALLTQIIALDAHQVDAYYQRGIVLLQQAQYDSAMADFDLAIALDPQHAQAYYYRGFIYSRREQHDLAIADYRQVILLEPESGTTYVNLGWELILQGHFEEAKDICAKAYELNPESFAAAVNLGHAYLLTGDGGTAREYYEKTVSLLSSEEEFLAGPVADFELFIERGWQAEACRGELAWMERRFEQVSAWHAISKKLMNYLLVEDKTEEAMALVDKVVSGGVEEYGLDPSQISRSLAMLAGLCFMQNKYEVAGLLAERALTLGEQVLGPDHPDLGVPLDFLALIKSKQSEFATAESLYTRSLTIQEKALEPDHAKMASTLMSFARLYRTQARYAEAEPLLKRALEIREKDLGPDHPDVAVVLKNLAQLYVEQGHHSRAEPLFKRALAIKEQALGPDHPDVANYLADLASYYMLQSKYSKAESLYERALALKEQAGDSDPEGLASLLNNLGNLYEDLGKYTEAEGLLKRSLDLKEQALGPDHPGLVTSLSNLGSLYRGQGKYAEAESLLKRAMVLTEQSLGVAHPQWATLLNNLGELYRDQAKYEEAEEQYKRALQITEESLGPDHPDLAKRRYNLGHLYWEQGKYAEAKEQFGQSIDLYERTLGPDHQDLGLPLNGLAILYKGRAQFGKAETLYQRILSLYEQALGPDHPRVADCLGNLALLYNAQAKYSKAEPLYKRALAIDEQAFGKDHIRVATPLHNLASFYISQGRDEEGEAMLERALAIREQSLGSDHPEVATTLINLGLAAAALGRPAAALPLMLRSLSIEERVKDNVFAMSSERDKLVFLNSMVADYDLVQGLVFQKLAHEEESVRAALDLALRRKGIVQEAMFRERLALLHSDDPRTTVVAARLGGIRSRLASLTFAGPGSMPVDSYRSFLKELEAEAEHLEEQLAGLSGVYAAERSIRQTSATAVVGELRENSALVEYIGYQNYDFQSAYPEPKWGAYRYLAFVLLAGSEGDPVLIDLGEATPIDEAIRDFRQEMARASGSIRAQGEDKAEKHLRQLSHRIYKLAFAPLQEALGKSQTIYLSPDGQLNLIPFEVLADPDGHYLVETYRFNYLSSGRDLLRRPVEETSGSGIVVLANPDYDLGSDQRTALARSMRENQHLAMGRSADRSNDLRASRWQRLAGTQEEADAIDSLLSGSEEVALYVDTLALEEVAKSVRSPRILHLATHGFFLEQQPMSERDGRGVQLAGTLSAAAPARHLSGTRIENPLLRSGLVLAGANRLGELDAGTEVEDGILTALEISGLPLWGTELVVLSACETGVGEARIGEGVFGLRRAFQLAGAETVVMSLWSIPDRETATLMRAFYRHLQAGKGRAAALRLAALGELEARQALYGAAHPYYWGAFVCVGKP